MLRTLEGPLDKWAYSVGRLNYMLGKPVRYSGLQRDRVARLFHREHARYPNKRVHADLLVDGPAGLLRQKMIHFYIRSFDHMIAKMTRYAQWSAAQMCIDGKSASGRAGSAGSTTRCSPFTALTRTRAPAAISPAALAFQISPCTKTFPSGSSCVRATPISPIIPSEPVTTRFFRAFKTSPMRKTTMIPIGMLPASAVSR